MSIDFYKIYSNKTFKEEVENYKRVQSLPDHKVQGHFGIVTSVAFSSTHEILASGSQDKTIKL